METFKDYMLEVVRKCYSWNDERRIDYFHPVRNIETHIHTNTLKHTQTVEHTRMPERIIFFSEGGGGGKPTSNRSTPSPSHILA